MGSGENHQKQSQLIFIEQKSLQQVTAHNRQRLHNCEFSEKRRTGCREKNRIVFFFESKIFFLINSHLARNSLPICVEFHFYCCTKWSVRWWTALRVLTQSSCAENKESFQKGFSICVHRQKLDWTLHNSRVVCMQWHHSSDDIKVWTLST